MFHPTRGGVRGGRDQFDWESVKTDKDRECYLGHSVKASVGRWQEGRDIMWYTKQKKTFGFNKSSEFIEAKRLEERALMAALGFNLNDPQTATSGSAHCAQRNPTENENSNGSVDEEEWNEILLFLVKRFGYKSLARSLRKRCSKRLRSSSSENAEARTKKKRKTSENKNSKHDSRHRRKSSTSSTASSSSSSSHQKTCTKRSHHCSSKGKRERHNT